MKRLGYLLGGTLGVWLLAVYPAYLQWREPAVVYSAVAMVLCLIPTTLTLLWANWAFEQSPEQQLSMILGGTGVRMIFVMGAALVLHYSVPYFEHLSFWVWILAFYLLTLTLEMVLIVKGRSVTQKG